MTANTKRQCFVEQVGGWAEKGVDGARRRMTAGLGGALVLCALLAVSSATMAQTGTVVRYALVIGVPRAEGKSPLAYADDDAIHMRTLLFAAGAEVDLLTAESNARPSPSPPKTTTTDPNGGASQSWTTRPEYRHSLPNAPTYNNLLVSLANIVAKVQKHREEHKRTQGCNISPRQSPCPRIEVIIFFSGHGGDGALYLADKPITGALLRGKLFELLGEDVDAIHLLIDACDVAGSRTSASANIFTDELKLSSDDRVNLFLGRTDEGKLLEWPAIQAGVLSFLFRSALAGGADISNIAVDDGGDVRVKVDQGNSPPDGGVSYLEMGAFIKTATRKVSNDRARIHPVSHVMGSSDEATDRTIITWDVGLRGDRYYEVELPQIQGRVRVRDAWGKPFIETHYGSKRSKVRLRLPSASKYTIERLECAVDDRNPHEACKWGVKERKVWTPDASAPNGLAIFEELKGEDLDHEKGSAEDEALRNGLYAVPFGEEQFVNYSPELLPKETAEPEAEAKGAPRQLMLSPWWTYAACGLTAAGGGLFAYGAVEEKQSYEAWQTARNQPEYERLGESNGNWLKLKNASMIGTIGVGAGCVTLLVLGQIETERPGVSLAVTGNGALLNGRF